MSTIYNFLLFLAVITLLHGRVDGQNQPPAYIGTETQFRDFLFSEMYYPPLAREQQPEGEVTVHFTVLTTGEVVGARASGTASKTLCDEAIRLVRRAIWKPAISGGKPVSATTSIAIPFSLKKYLRQVKKRGYDFPMVDSIPADTCVIVYETRLTDKPASPRMKPEVKLNEYLAKNLHYPEAARKQSITGKVKIRFVVEPAGYACHFKIEEHVSGGCTEEALRLLNEMKWNPALKNGKAVRSWYFMSFGFGSNGSDFQYFPANQGGSSMN